MNIVDEIIKTKEKVAYSKGKMEFYNDFIKMYETKLKKEEERLETLCSHEIVVGFDYYHEKMGLCLICGKFFELEQMHKVSNVIDKGILLNPQDLLESDVIVKKYSRLMYRILEENPNISFEELRYLIAERLENQEIKR